jgi:hypothetical protein
VAKMNDGEFGKHERHVLECLGKGVVLEWNKWPNDLQRKIFEAAVAANSNDRAGSLRDQLALFLHEHKDDFGTPDPSKH